MKKLFQNKYFLTVALITVGLSIGWVSTYGNKKWLIDQLAAYEDVTDTMLKTYEVKTASELRQILKSKKA